MPERFLNSLSLRFARMRSVKVKFFAAIAAVAVVFILVITSLNLFFYESYYMAQRQNSLTEIYEEVRTSYHAGDSGAFLGVLFMIQKEIFGRALLMIVGAVLLYQGLSDLVSVIQISVIGKRLKKNLGVILEDDPEND